MLFDLPLSTFRSRNGPENIPWICAYLTISIFCLRVQKYFMKILKFIFTWLQILMNAGMRVHVLQVTDVLIRKVHMSAHHQSQVILSEFQN